MPVQGGNLAITLGVFTGTLMRIYLLRSDYRQYPSYPHGFISHLSLGVVAAFIGAVAIPALIEGEFTAATFLALAAQQFREVRAMERTTLENLETSELVSRGPAYIEGIARVFEARNYLVIGVALLVAGGTALAEVWVGLVLGIVAFFLAALLIGQESIGQMATIEPSPLSFDGPGLYVGDVFIMNVGLKESRETILEHGLGATLAPKDDNARDTLANDGQRQAILHDVSVVLGVRRDVDEPEFTPLMRRDLDTGRLALFTVPVEPDIESLLRTIERVPVLESSRGRSLEARAGRKAAD